MTEEFVSKLYMLAIKSYFFVFNICYGREKASSFIIIGVQC